MLKLDDPSAFTAEIFNFSGNGALSGSDQIDLTNINSSTVHDSYSNGVLTVSDGSNTDTLDFNGSYVQANFSFASDGSGGAIVYDPPASQNASPSSNDHADGPATAGPSIAANTATDTFVFPPNFGQATIDHYNPTAATIEFDHTSFQTAAAVLAAARDDGHDAVITDSSHDAITLHNVLVAQLHQDDFLIK